MSEITSEPFGKTKDGDEVTRYIFYNKKHNTTVKIINYGCIITEILVPDKNGIIDDINLGHDDIQGYEERNRPYFGGVIGRYATRVANGKFCLDGKDYDITVNNGPNHLHGGNKGFTLVMWKSQVKGDKLELKYTSADGEEGFPGEVTTTVTYQLTADNELVLDYEATTTKPTPINLTNHAYFNLKNQAARSIKGHYITVNADTYVEINENWIPTGKLLPVERSLRDLRKRGALEDRLDVDRGFTVHYNLGEPGTMKYAAKVDHPESGRSVEVYTTEPGLQCYFSYETLHNDIGCKGGVKYGQYSAFCLEAMHFPDSCNHDNFPSCILRPGETYKQTTKYKFAVDVL